MQHRYGLGNTKDTAKGTSPKDIPVQTAEFFLTINLETADATGLQVSDEILQQAKVVIRPGEANQ